MRPLIVVNLKAYDSVCGESGLAMVEAMEEAQKEHPGVEFVPCPQMVDLAWIARQCGLRVFSQHVDALTPGSWTGWTTPEAVKSAGAAGTLINHAEHRLQVADIEALVVRCRGLGLDTIVCTNNLPVSKGCALLGPDYVAVEPPELIGGGISVTTADPEIVRGTVEEVRKVAPGVKVLCGAGVRTGEDVATAIELGTVGVLLASGVAKAHDPRAALEELVSKL